MMCFVHLTVIWGISKAPIVYDSITLLVSTKIFKECKASVQAKSTLALIYWVCNRCAADELKKIAIASDQWSVF